MRFNYSKEQIEELFDIADPAYALGQYNLFGFNMQFNITTSKPFALQFFSAHCNIKSRIYLDIKFFEIDSLDFSKRSELVFLDFDEPNVFHFVFKDLSSFFLPTQPEIVLFSSLSDRDFLHFFSSSTLISAQFNSNCVKSSLFKQFFFNGSIFTVINLNHPFPGFKTGFFNNANLDFFIPEYSSFKFFNVSSSVVYFLRATKSRAMLSAELGDILFKLYIFFCRTIYSDESHKFNSYFDQALSKIIELFSSYRGSLDNDFVISSSQLVDLTNSQDHFSDFTRFSLHQNFSSSLYILLSQSSWIKKSTEFSTVFNKNVNQDVLHFVERNPFAVGYIHGSFVFKPEYSYFSKIYPKMEACRISLQEFRTLFTTFLTFDIKVAKFYKASRRPCDCSAPIQFFLRLGLTPIFTNPVTNSHFYRIALNSFVYHYFLNIEVSKIKLPFLGSSFSGDLLCCWFTSTKRAIMLEYALYFKKQAVNFFVFQDGFATTHHLGFNELSKVGFYNRYLHRRISLIKYENRHFTVFEPLAFPLYVHISENFRGNHFRFSDSSLCEILSCFGYVFDFKSQMCYYHTTGDFFTNSNSSTNFISFWSFGSIVQLDFYKDKQKIRFLFKPSLYGFILAFRPSTRTTPSATAITDPESIVFYLF